MSVTEGVGGGGLLLRLTCSLRVNVRRGDDCSTADKTANELAATPSESYRACHSTTCVKKKLVNKC